eukprot:CAMPEP_0197283490 /NCGR_PEP_ID=MMETSP1432-20130617/24954_1 /TAXON_ID=44447 /ORGANISM="Pseudo-nitzschia delicatissima, Strain UNC1205" /LENGTH=248 /DNA_ID=CAMNT_0042750481 /DNA_START=3019 /DNA_END=3765 /DNA_ORIENTATION=-
MTTPPTDAAVTVYGFLFDQNIIDGSPFVAKLVTFLKMAKTEYKFVPFPDHMLSGSPKGKMPWIVAPGILGEDAVADTTIIIGALAKADPATFDLDKHLSPGDKAVGHAFKVMVEESLYWSLVQMRWQPDQAAAVTIPLFFPGYPWPVQKMMGWYLNRGIQASLQGQGTGKLTNEEITTKATSEIKALSDFLGSKKYFMGDKITSYDATMYSFLVAEVKGDWKHPICDAVKDCKNLVDYVERMHAEFWS